MLFVVKEEKIKDKNRFFRQEYKRFIFR